MPSELALPATPPAPGAEVCAACGAALTGPFCSACGERRPLPDDERLRPFLRDQFHEVTSADGKLWRTVRSLWVPGKLTVEFFSGRRGLYVRPVRLFLVVNVVLFFLFRGNSGTILKGPLRSNYGAALYGSTAERMAQDAATRWGLGIDAVEAAFDAHATSLAPTLLGMLIPAFAVVFAVVLWPARARGVRHLVHATHVVSSFLAGALVLMILIWLAMDLSAVMLGWRFDSPDPVLLPAVILALCAFLGVSIRRVYGVGAGYATAAGIGIGTLGFGFAFWSYRMALFFVTIWTLGAPATP